MCKEMPYFLITFPKNTTGGKGQKKEKHKNICECGNFFDPISKNVEKSRKSEIKFAHSDFY